jgi:hypothetical protein
MCVNTLISKLRMCINLPLSGQCVTLSGLSRREPRSGDGGLRGGGGGQVLASQELLVSHLGGEGEYVRCVVCLCLPALCAFQNPTFAAKPTITINPI